MSTCAHIGRKLKKQTLHTFSLWLSTRKIIFEPLYIFKVLSLFIFLCTSHSNPIALQFSIAQISEWMYSGHQLSSVKLSFISTPITEYSSWLGLSKYYGIFTHVLFSSFHFPLVPLLPYDFNYDQMTPAASSLYISRSHCIAQQFSTSWQVGAWGHI